MEAASPNRFVYSGHFLNRDMSADKESGIPHASTKDCVYKGYFIPAGSTIHAMEW
jgi:hypothetical protein